MKLSLLTFLKVFLIIEQLYAQCIDDYIPNIVDIIMNALLTNLPGCAGVNHEIVDINREGAPTPIDLGTLFFDKWGHCEN